VVTKNRKWTGTASDRNENYWCEIKI